ncbi:MAG: HD domain-containing protein [Spirochaetota bacterium]
MDQMQFHTYSFLTTACTEAVRDPVWGTVMFPESFTKLMALGEFQKLSRIKQLGPTHLLYPGAVHTRLSHSIGVYAAARSMIFALLRQLHTAGSSPPWDLTGIKSFLCAALLHDIGHFPFTHSLKDLPLRSHESLASQIILEGSRVKAVIEEDIGASARMTAAIIDDSQEAEDPQVALFRSMLSGTLDPDKLDYLNRDAFFCGVPYGLQDVDYILTKIALTRENRLAVKSQGIGSIEHLLFAKYLMYRNVYWHETVRSATAMIRKALFTGLSGGNIQPDELYHLDDRQLLKRFSGGAYPFCAPIDGVAAGTLYRPVLRLALSEFTPKQQQLLRDQKRRYEIEEHLRDEIERHSAAQLNPWEIVLDIPEPVSFEADVPVLLSDGSSVPFSEAGPVFSRPVIDGFTRALSHVRLFLPPGAGAAIDKTMLLKYLA